MASLLDENKKRYSGVKIVLLFLITIMIVSASIIISISLTVCCLVNQKEILDNLQNKPYKRGVVASDQQNCSKIGVDVLKENGTAVDAAIATLLCLGVLNMHSSGIGGGGVMVVHPSKNNVSLFSTETEDVVYDYREVVPKKIPTILNETDPKLFSMGGLSITVPGEIAGLYAAWKDYGKLSWKRLFQPSIDLAKNGFPFHRRLWEASNFMKNFVLEDEGLSSILSINGTIREKDSLIKNEKLAETLEKISLNPTDFYTGDLAKLIVEDIKRAKGVMELEDLQNYKVLKRKTVNLNLGNGYVIKAAPPPFGGIIVETILNILKGYNFTNDDLKIEKAAYTYHLIAEAMKFAFAKRTLFADPDFMNKTLLKELVQNLTSLEYGESIRAKILNKTQDIEYYDPLFSVTIDNGTTHVSIRAPDGSAVSITHSINIWFGSGYRSTVTGITYNNEIDDFSIKNRTNAFHLKPTPTNRIETNKRPLSSMSPILVTKDNEVELIVGGSGGTRIITSVASFLMYKLWFGLNLAESVVHPRIHHQLTPNTLVVEKMYPLPKNVLDTLKNTYGHNIGYTWIPEYSSVQAVYIDGETIYGKSDPRKYGVEEGF